MRRTLIWTLTATALLALTATASAVVTEQPRAVSQGRGASPREEQAAPLGAARPVFRTAEAGQTESISRKLTYLDGQSAAVLAYPGAEYVKVHFASLLVLPGDYVTVSNLDGSESHRVNRPGWAMSITGDTARVVLHRTTLLSGLIGQLGVVVDQVARGFTETERVAAAERSRAWKRQQGREESVCGNDDKYDAVCYKTTDPVLYRRSKAVARLLIKGTELCTGFRVGPHNRMMTNFHCVGTAEEAGDTEVWFNYQCAECGGYEVFRPTKVWLSDVIASDKTLDYTLFSVTDFDYVARFGYLELDVRRPAMGEQLYIPQHPSGAPSMIAISSDQDWAGTCAVEENAYEGYAPDTDVSYHCDTEGGSSGSPVLSRDTNRVIALHHFGGCPNSGVRMEKIFTELHGLL